MSQSLHNSSTQPSLKQISLQDAAREQRQTQNGRASTCRTIGVT